jgi:hypothetical protein
LLNKSKKAMSPLFSAPFRFSPALASDIFQGVQYSPTDTRLGLLLWQGTRSHGLADYALVALDHQLNRAASP